MNIRVASALIMGSLTPVAASAVTYYSSPGATSSYVWDWAQGATYTNFAFNARTSAFVGSWRVDQGPSWSSTPIAYTGVQAAALLFGGRSDDYFTSTVDDVAAHADRLAWASGYGNQCADFGRCGVKVSQGFTSIDDKDTVPDVVAAVPEPATWLLMVSGFGLIGVSTRRRAVAARA